MDRCQIIKYSRLSDSTYPELSSYRIFFVTAPILRAAQLIRGVFYLDVSKLLVQEQ